MQHVKKKWKTSDKCCKSWEHSEMVCPLDSIGWISSLVWMRILYKIVVQPRYILFGMLEICVDMCGMFRKNLYQCSVFPTLEWFIHKHGNGKMITNTLEWLYYHSFLFLPLYSFIWAISNNICMEERRRYFTKESLIDDAQRISHTQSDNFMWSQRKLERFVLKFKHIYV